MINVKIFINVNNESKIWRLANTANKNSMFVCFDRLKLRGLNIFLEKRPKK